MVLDRIQSQLPVAWGCTLQELALLSGLSFSVLFVPGAIGLAFFLDGLGALLLAGVLALVLGGFLARFLLKRLARLKHQKPYGYYQQWLLQHAIAWHCFPSPHVLAGSRYRIGGYRGGNS